jgi:hypothetical protein
VEDSEVDVAKYKGADQRYPIEPEMLRVFPSDSDLPADQQNVTIDEQFVPVAKVDVPRSGEFESWKRELLAGLRKLPLRHLPEEIPAATLLPQKSDRQDRLATEEGIVIGLRTIKAAQRDSKDIVLLVANSDGEVSPKLLERFRDSQAVYIIQPRGTADGRWTHKDPPNYVERSLVLLGQTADTGRIWDIVATTGYVLHQVEGAKITLAGEGSAGVLAAYAALLSPQVDRCIALRPQLSHMDEGAPQLVSVMRVCDVEDVFGLLAPRKLSIIGAARTPEKVQAIYKAAGAGDSLQISSPAE